MTTSRPQISRRTIAKGAAWAVPVIAVGAPVPAMAASGCLTGTVVGSQYPDPDVAPYINEITVTNTGPGVIPAETMFDFTLMNGSVNAADLVTFTAQGAVWASPDMVVPPRGSVPLHLFITADIPVGGTIVWSFLLQDPEGSVDWASFTNITPERGCGSIQGCVSRTDVVYGFDCPTTPLG